MTTEERVRQLRDRAVADLIEAHKRRTDEPLVLAVVYEQDQPEDVYLLEAISGFPGGDDDELLTTEFEPSAQLLIIGKLHLSLGSPAQVRAAVQRGDAIIDRVRMGTVAYSDGSTQARELAGLLGL